MAATNLARKTSQIARPLKILVPLIQQELVAGNEAGLEHYRLAGVMLTEAKEQVAYGSWARWLTKNFELSDKTARRYMRLARVAETHDDFTSVARDRTATLASTIGERVAPRMGAWGPIRDAADKLNVTRFADERQKRDDENKLHRELALKLIDLGYRALATRLHPDRGGSRDAMSRLNTVRDELKSIAETRRFV